MIRVRLFNIYHSTVTCDCELLFVPTVSEGQGRTSPVSPYAPKLFASSLYGYRIKIRKTLRAVNNFVASGTHFLPLPGRRLPLPPLNLHGGISAFKIFETVRLSKLKIIYLSQTANGMPRSLSACRRTTLVKSGSKNWRL